MAQRCFGHMPNQAMFLSCAQTRQLGFNCFRPLDAAFAAQVGSVLILAIGMKLFLAKQLGISVCYTGLKSCLPLKLQDL